MGEIQSSDNGTQSRILGQVTQKLGKYGRMRNCDMMIQGRKRCCVDCSRSEQTGDEIDIPGGVVVGRDFESELGNDVI